MIYVFEQPPKGSTAKTVTVDGQTLTETFHADLIPAWVFTSNPNCYLAVDDQDGARQWFRVQPVESD